jgi:hypothetical protein
MAEQLALAEREASEQVITPLGLIQLAAARGASVEQMAQLFELKLRVEADEARKAFNAAMASFKKTPPRITKNKDVAYGTTKYSHATLDHAADAIIPALSLVGISHKWATEQKDSKIIVHCILTHVLGHSEQTTLEAGADTSGSKNAIQAIGSAVTYLQRYTLLAACGLAAEGTDNDGIKAGSQMNEQAYVGHLDNIQNSRTQEELKKVFAVAYKDANDAGDTAARDEFVKAKDNKKQELAR